MAEHSDIARAIAQKDARSVLKLLFEGNPPRLRLGRKTENDLWDFKVDCPTPGRDDLTENGWAHVASDVLAFHNNRGGVLLFGIDDKRMRFTGATRTLDSKKFNDRLRRYVGDLLWVDYYREFIQADQRYLGVALIPPRGPQILRFKSSAPMINGKRHFERAGTALREHDSTRIFDPAAADRFSKERSAPAYGEKYSVNEPFYRLLAPDYSNFLQRGQIGQGVEKSMRDPRVAVTSLIGVGGMGKTALATWAVRRAFDAGDFRFIVSTTAKDRELSASGILGLRAPLTSFEDLLDQTLDVLGFPEVKTESIQAKQREVRDLLTNSEGLLYVDNLETVDDKRMVAFLDDLPVGARAVVTSRRNSVRTAARPISIPPLSDAEQVDFLRLLATEPLFSHIRALSNAEAVLVGRAWDGIPLALRWVIGRTKSVPELLQAAQARPSQRMDAEQLLEFSFRRVFETLSQAERAVLETLSVLETPVPTEAVVAGAGVGGDQALDAVEELVDDSLVQRVFDAERNDYCFTVLPVTRAFARLDLQRRPAVAEAVRRRLTNWFEATDITNLEDRLVIREMRTGKNADDAPLVDLARGAERRGDLDSAEKLYKQALARNPRSWRAARQAGEFYRHKRKAILEAIALYEISAANAPKRGADRSIIFREYGLLLRESGRPDAQRQSEEMLRTALAESPSDLITVGTLAGVLDARGAYREVIKLLRPFEATENARFRRKSLPVLLRAYEQTNELLDAARLRDSLR